MPHSMTGFATAEALFESFRLVWEIRSVNHRFLELGVRLPEELRTLEGECRDVVAASIKRGKVDCTLRLDSADGAGPAGKVVPGGLAALRALEQAVRAAFPDARPLSAAEILRWPGVLEEPRQIYARLHEPATQCLGRAVEALQDARRREGARIADAVAKRNAAIAALMDGVRPLLAGVQQRHRDKLRERLERLDVQADPARLEQELALIAQRVDVAEEVDRLASHVTEVDDVLRRDEPVGRRLDFVIQELNREANTFASKVQEEALSRTAVELKVLIEQMREQVQNLE